MDRVVQCSKYLADKFACFVTLVIAYEMNEKDLRILKINQGRGALLITFTWKS